LDEGASPIRLVGPDEYVELREVRLHALAYADHLVSHLAREAGADQSFWRERALKAASGETMATFVATGSERFVGVVDGFLSDDGRMVEVGGMWVDPVVRRTGVGRGLLAAVSAWARTRGAERVGLWVRWENQPARLLYEGEGFEVTRSDEVGARLERPL
jgi:GNAT superfamily N-acetyltransferase